MIWIIIIVAGLILLKILTVYLKGKKTQQTQQRVSELKDQVMQIKETRGALLDRLLHKELEVKQYREQDKELEKQRDELEDVLYDLTGEAPTRYRENMYTAWMAQDMEERWKRQHGMIVNNNSNGETHQKKNIPWFALGVAFSRYEEMKRELNKQNKELQKALDKINKSK